MDSALGAIPRRTPQGAWEPWRGDARRSPGSLSCSEGGDDDDGGGGGGDEPLPSLLISAPCSVWRVQQGPSLGSPKHPRSLASNSKKSPDSGEEREGERKGERERERHKLFFKVFQVWFPVAGLGGGGGCFACLLFCFGFFFFLPFFLVLSHYLFVFPPRPPSPPDAYVESHRLEKQQQDAGRLLNRFMDTAPARRAKQSRSPAIGRRLEGDVTDDRSR